MKFNKPKIRIKVFSYWRAKKKEKAALIRKNKIEELALAQAIKAHWKETDIVLRRIDAIDSIFELERRRKETLQKFQEIVIDEINAKYVFDEYGKVERRDQKDYNAEMKVLTSKVADFKEPDDLKRHYYALCTMEMYKRHNINLRARLLETHKEGVRTKQQLEKKIADLQYEIAKAKREAWCYEETKVWEPTVDSHFERKKLVLQDEGKESGGPESPCIFGIENGTGGIARLVDRVEMSPRELLLIRGKTYADKISKKF